jgi:hypothetical protein
VASLSSLVSDTSADRAIRAAEWRKSEILAWVKAHREQDLDLSGLDRDMQRECWAELKRQLEAEVDQALPPESKNRST